MKAWQMLAILNIGIIVFEIINQKWTFSITVIFVTPIPVLILYWADKVD